MVMAKKQRRKRGVVLPWEERAALLRGAISRSRWKTAALLVVVALAGYFIYRAADHAERVRRTRHAIDEMHRAIADFRADVGRCPRSPDELLHPPRGGTRYLRELPEDGWGRRLFVRCPRPNDPDDAEVMSAGPSGDFFVDDNVR
jgi:hypothetical protein